MEHVIFVVLEMFVHQKCTGEISTDNPISSLLKKKSLLVQIENGQKLNILAFSGQKKSVLKICYYLLVKLML